MGRVAAVGCGTSMYGLTVVFMAHKEQCASDKADQEHDYRDAQVDPGDLKDYLRIGWLPVRTTGGRCVARRRSSWFPLWKSNPGTALGRDGSGLT
jgi:hypothetical protein